MFTKVNISFACPMLTVSASRSQHAEEWGGHRRGKTTPIISITILFNSLETEELNKKHEGMKINSIPSSDVLNLFMPNLYST